MIIVKSVIIEGRLVDDEPIIPDDPITPDEPIEPEPIEPADQYVVTAQEIVDYFNDNGFYYQYYHFITYEPLDDAIKITVDLTSDPYFYLPPIAVDTLNQLGDNKYKYMTIHYTDCDTTDYPGAYFAIYVFAGIPEYTELQMSTYVDGEDGSRYITADMTTNDNWYRELSNIRVDFEDDSNNWTQSYPSITIKEIVFHN